MLVVMVWRRVGTEETRQRTWFRKVRLPSCGRSSLAFHIGKRYLVNKYLWNPPLAKAVHTFIWGRKTVVQSSQF